MSAGPASGFGKTKRTTLAALPQALLGVVSSQPPKAIARQTVNTTARRIAQEIAQHERRIAIVSIAKLKSVLHTTRVGPPYGIPEL